MAPRFPERAPLDPRHRLVTTKYNPARTWTPQNAVGIGGAYMCIYGMEGPGGYQFVGRTVQVWNTHRSTREFEPGKPWLLRFFDQIRFQVRRDVHADSPRSDDRLEQAQHASTKLALHLLLAIQLNAVGDRLWAVSRTGQ